MIAASHTPTANPTPSAVPAAPPSLEQTLEALRDALGSVTRGYALRLPPSACRALVDGLCAARAAVEEACGEAGDGAFVAAWRGSRGSAGRSRRQGAGSSR